VVIKTFPERGQPSFDLQLPDNRLAVIFRSDVCSQRDEKSSIHILFQHAALALLQSSLPLAFCASGLFLLPGLANTLWLWLLLGSIPPKV